MQQRTEMSDTHSDVCLERGFAEETISGELFELLSGKWVARTICVLHGRTLRYCELERALNGISQRMLTRTLKQLEHRGLVQRTVQASVPPHVEYRLSRLGVSLVRPLLALLRWSRRFGHRLTEASAR